MCTVCTVCTQCVHSVYTVCTHAKCLQLWGGYRTAVPHECTMHAASVIRSSTSSSGFSIRIFLWSQICPICESFFDFSKVLDRFSTSWNSESLRKLQPYTIMGTLPSTLYYDSTLSVHSCTSSTDHGPAIRSIRSTGN